MLLNRDSVKEVEDFQKTYKALMDKDPDLASRWLNGQLIDARLKYLDMVNRKTAIAIGLIKPGVEVSSKPETMAL